MLPIYLLQLKADFSIDDCVTFLNKVTENGEREFKNVYVALPFSRLKEMQSLFPDSGIFFGADHLNRTDEGSFTKSVACQMVVNHTGTFVVVGGPEERNILKTTDEQILAKLNALKNCHLKTFFCFSLGQEVEQLKLLKESALPLEEVILVYTPPFTYYKTYLPSQEELKSLFEQVQEKIQEVFQKEIPTLIALPNDLAGFSGILEQSPFAGAYFVKSGLYPHTIHEENVKLFHVNH